MTFLLQDTAALLAITNQLGFVPAFLAITDRLSPSEHRAPGFERFWRSPPFLAWSPLPPDSLSLHLESRCPRFRLPMGSYGSCD